VCCCSFSICSWAWIIVIMAEFMMECIRGGLDLTRKPGLLLLFLFLMLEKVLMCISVVQKKKKNKPDQQWHITLTSHNGTWNWCPNVSCFWLMWSCGKCSFKDNGLASKCFLSRYCCTYTYMLHDICVLWNIWWWCLAQVTPIHTYNLILMWFLKSKTTYSISYLLHTYVVSTGCKTG